MNALYEKNPSLFDYETRDEEGKKKKPGDNAILALAEILNAMDWTQTRQIARQPDIYSESGPLMQAFAGEHPSKGKVNAFFLAKALALAAANKKLPDPYRNIFNALTIMDMGSAIKNNHGIGLDVMRF